MKKTIAIIAAAAAALTSTIGMAREAEPTAAQSFVHDGSTYVYTTKVVDGRSVIDGHRYPNGSAFHLVVRGDTVSGISGGVPVSFRTAVARGAAANAAVEVAAR